MPAGVPPAGLDRRFFTADRSMRNTGADTTVNYQVVSRNAANGDIMVGGDNDYVGLMTDGIFGEIVEGAVLPPAATAWRFSALNKGDGGWLLLDSSNNLFRVTADLTGSVTITSPAVITRNSVVEYNGRIMVASNLIAAPNRDIEFSDDNGATWDSDPGIFTGIGFNLSSAFRTNFQQNILVACSQGGTNAAFTTDEFAASGTWTLIPVNTLGVPMTDVAISDDGRKAVIVVSNGQITTTDDQFATTFNIPDAINPFVSNVVGSVIFSAVFVADLDGFILTTSSGDIQAFIPVADMENIFVGSYLGEIVTTQGRCVISDGFQALWPSSTDRAMCTLRNIGQLGKT